MGFEDKNKDIPIIKSKKNSPVNINDDSILNPNLSGTKVDTKMNLIGSLNQKKIQDHPDEPALIGSLNQKKIQDHPDEPVTPFKNEPANEKKNLKMGNNF